MSNENFDSVCKLPVNDSVRQVVIKTSWTESSFNVTLFEQEKAYEGVMTKEKISQVSRQLGITAEDYINQCKKALSNNGGSEDFIYILDDNMFQWKKIHFDMKITFGTIQLTSVPVIKTLEDVIDVSVNNYYHLKEKVILLEQEKDLLENDNRELLQKISDCINLKTDLESQLYNQFLIVLNAKKRKIARLEKKLKLNGIEVSLKEEEEDGEDEQPQKQEETGDEEMKKLYECDTEVESDNSDSGEEKEGSSKVTKKSSENDSLDFDSDLDNMTSYELPRRNKINKKSPGNSDGAEISSYKKDCSSSSSSVFKPRNKKRLSDERELNNDDNDDRPGPSITKISKIMNKNEKKNLNKESKMKSKCKMEESESDEETNCSNIKQNGKTKVLLEEHEKSHSGSHYNKSFSMTNEDKKGTGDNMNKAINKISENGEKVSTVDDIISNLIA